ncbi:DUF1573 domain-containing protein [bacterium]|nr:DUF1573 domain-containing protein [bacterium]
MKSLQEFISPLVTATVLGMSVLSLGELSAQQPQSGPKIEALQPNYEFGAIYRGAVVTHKFSLRNVGRATLVIDNVRSSCGCTVALADKKEVAPGESTYISASFDSGRFSGKVQKEIYVQSNDSLQPVTKLSLEGEVRVDLSVSPNQMYFSGLKEGERIERKINLLNTSEITIGITEVSCTVPDVRFELPKLKLKPGENTQMLLVVDKVTRETKLTGSMTIHFTGPQKEVTIKLYSRAVD